MRTQVAIIGAGPAGLLLGQLLHKNGIDNIILERQTADYVRGRIRAGVIEQVTMDLLDEAGVGARMHADGLVHDGVHICVDGKRHHLSFKELTGKSVMVYGQTEITRDLMDGPRRSRRADRLFRPRRRAARHFRRRAARHLPSRRQVRRNRLRLHRRLRRLPWRQPPERAGEARSRPSSVSIRSAGSASCPTRRRSSDELIYVRHPSGFALCSMRSPTRSRYYIQCSLDDHVDAWPDERFWEALKPRLDDEGRANLVTGPSIEKSIAPLRSFVAEPMRFGRLFLAGDAAHIVPPTGAKGLNLAASDVQYLARALVEHYHDKSDAGLDHYSARALARVWKAERFSWWMTTTLHRISDNPFDHRLQLAELDYLFRSKAGADRVCRELCGAAVLERNSFI